MTRKRRTAAPRRMHRPSKLSMLGPRYGASPATIVVVSLVAAGFLFLGIWARWQVFEFGSEIQIMNSNLHQLTQENKYLQIQVAEMTDQQRLEKKAKEYGLKTPGAGQIKRID